MGSEDAVELYDALLKWTQAFATKTQVVSLLDLRDGHALSEILIDIDNDYFVDKVLPAPSTKETASNWVPRWQNLDHIQRNVNTYVTDVCGVLDSSQHAAFVDEVSLRSLAMYSPMTGVADQAKVTATMTVLLKSILRAAMYSPVSNQRMGRLVMELGPEPARVIASAMAEMEDDDTVEGSHDQAHINDNQSDTPAHQLNLSTDDDLTLEQEGRLIQAHRVIKSLEESNAKAADELAGLRRDKIQLEEALGSFRDELEKSDRQADTSLVQELKSQTARDRIQLADLESDLSTARTTAEAQDRLLQRLKADSDSRQQLRDELQLLQAERDELIQKTRASDNLRKKIQALQDQDKQNIHLRQDLQEAREQLQDMEHLREQCGKLQKANSENLTIIASTEQEIFDQKTTRKRLEHELQTSLQRLASAQDRQTRDQEHIVELEKRLQTQEANDSMTPASEYGGALESELLAVEAARSTRPRGMTKNLTAEVEQRVHDKLKAVNARNAHLETEYIAILQDKLGLETVVQDLSSTSATLTEQNSSFLEQRNRLDLAHDELHKLKDAVFKLTAELATAKEKVLTAHTPTLLSRRGSKMDESDTDSIATDTIHDIQAEYRALTKSYSELTRHSEDIEAQLVQQKSLVRHALLQHRAIDKEPAEMRKTNEYSLMLEQLQSIRQAQDQDNIVVDVATAMADKIELARIDTAVERQVRTLVVISMFDGKADSLVESHNFGGRTCRIANLAGNRTRGTRKDWPSRPSRAPASREQAHGNSMAGFDEQDTKHGCHYQRAPRRNTQKLDQQAACESGYPHRSCSRARQHHYLTYASAETSKCTFSCRDVFALRSLVIQHIIQRPRLLLLCPRWQPSTVRVNSFWRQSRLWSIVALVVLCEDVAIE